MHARLRLDYQPLFGKMSPHSSPSLFGEEQRPDPGDGGNRAYARLCSNKNNPGRKKFQAVESRVTKIVFVAQQECKQCKMWPPMQTFLGVSHTSKGKMMLTEHTLN